MELQWQPLTRADAAAMAELNTAVYAADQAGELRSLAEMDRSFDDEWRVAVPARFGAFVHGTLVAFGVLFPRAAANPDHRMILWGMVHPAYRRRGIGTDVVRRGLAAAPDLHARCFPDALCRVVLELPDLPGTAELARACGFETSNHSFEMARPLPRDPAEFAGWVSSPGEGLVVRPFDLEHVEALRNVHNSSFVPDHPGSTPVSAEAWERRLSDPTFRRNLSFLMLDSTTHEVVGYVLSNHTREQAAQTGQRDIRLSTITTHRGYRRGGVATALIGAALSAAVAQGFDTASLNVDTDNPSGARRVYQRAGFTVTRSETTYTRGIDA